MTFPITNIPTATELHETADGWLMLAWDQVIGTALEWSEMSTYAAESGSRMKPGYQSKFWNAHRHQLNNALLLCQQAMELDLKARIAAVDPMALVAGKAATSLIQQGGNFLAAPTIGARQLPAAVEQITKTPLNFVYTTLFEQLRIERNLIAHLHGGNFPTEARSRLGDVLSVFSVIHPNDRWQRFCTANMLASGKDGPITVGDEDGTYSFWLRKFEAAVNLLDSAGARRHFGYDKRKRNLFCPNCWNKRRRHDDERRDFAQTQADGRIACAACLTVYQNKAAYEASC